MTETYTQCTLTNGSKQTVSFIPSYAAKLDSMVEMVDIDGEFWTVKGIGTILSKDKMRDQERNYKKFQGSTKGGGIDE